MPKDSNIVVYNYMDTFYCGYVEKDFYCEEMVTEHMLVYICSGELELVSPEKNYILKKGDSFFLKRNHMLRKFKRATKEGEPFKGLFLQLKAPFLKKIMKERDIMIPLTTSPDLKSSPYIMLKKHPFLSGLFGSLEQYFDVEQYPSEELMEAKLKEAVFTLLQVKPEIGTVLFDFTDPWKVDLAEFMNAHFKSNLSVEEFAHYTGRSLSSFKKDFYQIFKSTPSRWIVKKRLQEARHLINDKREKPSEVYLEVGFKNLSHFSTAFKKEFGIAPSALNTETIS
jgi:AraC-like DNA-binding protein